MAACDLELFDLLESSPGGAATADDIAKVKDWDKVALGRVLDALCSLKVISKTKNASGTSEYISY